MPFSFQRKPSGGRSGRRHRKNSQRGSHRRQPKRLSLERLEERQLLTADLLFRVNAGGPSLAGLPAWTTDSGFTNSGAASSNPFSVSTSINTSNASLPTGTPEALFQSERWDSGDGQEMQWDFSVTPGTYEVRLYFAEIYSGAQGVGQRVFDVAIEGATVLDNYDVYADVGGYTGVMKSFLVNSDANLDIDFARVTENPAVKGIEIRQVVVGNQLTSSQSTVNFSGTLIGNSVTQSVTLTNLGESGDPALTIDPADLSITGTDAGLFTATLPGGSPIVLAPGDSTTLNITFAPTDATTKQAELLLPHSGDNSPLSINLTGTGVSEVPINFGKSDLVGEDSSRPTSLQFGPDGRLYVAQQDGLIQIYTIDRVAANDYQVIATETLTQIQDLPNRDDDGTLNPSVTDRLVTGLLVTGTIQNPVIFVTSSDPRIGGGGSGADLNLDTNSGILSRLTWNGSSWDKLDLVRGLPRSEENHTANGLALDEATNTLYIAQGGNTNTGAPSNNFANLPEFALSAAILSIDLDAIGETTYDLPTLDDEDQPGVDTTDPFGGNDGKNQALLVPGGPVQVYAPGFRNSYDIVLTEQGRLYTINNGPNAGWGGTPQGEGPEGNATNAINNGGATFGDALHFITGEGYYGGHPNPTRSNPNNTFNASNPQSPVTVGNPIESDFRQPGAEDGGLYVWGSSTNGLTEYTASNFQGSLQGDLLAASFDNSIKRVKLNAAGDAVVLEEQLFSSVGVVPLDVTAVGDNGLFPGTIWVAAIGSGVIHVFEPADYGGAVVVDSSSNDDSDGDGFSNDDEIANGTNPDNAGDFPADNDGDFLSDLLDPDDDNDSILDTSDRFALDADNGLTTFVGVSYDWENEGASNGGLLNAGFTGLMTNGVDNYEDLFDISQITAGGAAGVLTLDQISEGDATGALNTQEQAFQFGVNLAGATTPVTARTRILAPFSGETPQGEQSMGLFIGNGDQDNYFKIVVGATGISTQLEVDGTVTTGTIDPIGLPGPAAIDLYLTIDITQSTVQASYQIDGGARINLGTPVTVPTDWLLSTSQGMAVGIISTSIGSAPAIPATWDLIEVLADAPSNLPPVLALISPQTLTVGETQVVNISASDPDGDNLSLDIANLPTWANFVDNGNGTGTLTLTPGANDAGSTNVVVTASDDGSPLLSDTQVVGLNVLPLVVAGEVVYRVNAGGPLVSDNPSWVTDGGFTNSGAASSQSFSNSANISLSNASIPTGTPSQLFQTERYDQLSGQEMQWNFDVTPGAYEVRLYFAETYGPTMGVGNRVFDVSIEGNLVLDNYDIFADVGGGVAVMKSFLVQSDGTLDIDFDRIVENPQVRAIEILTAGSSPNQLLSSETSLAWESVATDESVTQTLTLTNQGGAGDPTITIDTANLAITGSGAAAYAVTTTGVLSIAPGDSASIEIEFTPSATGGATANLSVVHSGNNSPLAVALSGVGVAPAPTNASAFVEVNGGGSLSSSSTFTAGSFNIQNNSLGGQKIESIRFDIDTAMLPDVAFDPNGAVGDPIGQGFSPTTGGLQTGQSTSVFSKPLHLGYQALEVAFDDFDPGEQFSFAVDIDPSTIRGASPPGPGDSASISGLELAGSLVTITFDDGSTVTSELFRQSGSNTSGVATVEVGAPAAPSLQFLGLPNTPTVVTNGNQIIRVSATPGATVRLLQAEAGLFLAGVPGGGFDVDPFESNNVIGLAEQTLTIGASGFVDVPVTLLDNGNNGGLNHFLAVVVEGDQTSDVARLLVEYNASTSTNSAPVLASISNPTVTAGDSQSILVTATDPNGDDIALSVTNLPTYASFTDNGNGTGTLVISPEISDIGSLAITVTATDDGTPALSDSQLVTITVEEEVIVDPTIDAIVYRVNAGGPAIPGNPTWTTDASFTNSGPAGSNSFSTSQGINLGNSSLPAGIPASLFQTERWDPPTGQEIQWDFDVTAGTYEVRLYFAEIYNGAQGVGQRVFDVTIEGQKVLDDYDVFAEVGGYTGVMKSFIIQSDTNLDIDFGREVENPAIKGIEIIRVAAAASTTGALTPDANLFFEITADASANLDPEGIYPYGQQIGFGLYSIVGQNDADPSKSNIERVAEEGFTLAGPYYNPDWEGFQFVYEAAAEGLKFTYQLRQHPSLTGIGFDGRPAAIALLSDQEIADYVRQQVEAVIDDPVANATVARWSLLPEELRYWIEDEIRYLRVASETIRQVELERGQEQRPLWMYEANNRTTEQLIITGEFQDITTKGSYLTTRDDRGPQRAGWATWSFDQIINAATQLGNTPQAVLQLFEDFTDPLTGTNPTEIERVIRHDTYLALVKGIESLNVFSGFENRPNLTTQNEQFEAYGSVANDLTGELNLQEAFLFGEDRDDLTIAVENGDSTFTYVHDDGSTFEFPTLNYLNTAVGDERYLILVNSTESTMEVSIAGLPGEYVVENLFTGTTTTETAQTMSVTLDKLGVVALKLRQIDS